MMTLSQEEKGLPQKISDDIIALILEENLKPGDKLPNETILSQRLDVGRSSLREAMKLLASRNIVTVRQGSGTYIAASPGMVEDPLGLFSLTINRSWFRIFWRFVFCSNLRLLPWLPHAQMKKTSKKSLHSAMK